MTAAKIFVDLDMIPRYCMALMLTVGGVLAEIIGISHPAWEMAAILLLGPFWLGMVLVVHAKEGSAAGETLKRVDIWFRWIVIVSIIVSVVHSHWTGRLDGLEWFSAKLLLFAFLVFCGIMVRGKIGPFFQVLMKCRAGQMPTPEENEAQRVSLSQVRVWVFMIWAGVFLSGFVGIVNRSGIVYGG